MASKPRIRTHRNPASLGLPGRPGHFIADAVLPLLLPGQAAVFELPAGQPYRNEYMRAISCVAWRMWGQGGAKQKTGPGTMRVQRVDRRGEEARDAA